MESGEKQSGGRATPLQPASQPSVNSDSKEDRIAARRKRVEVRIEAARREAMGEKPQETTGDEDGDPERERRSRKQEDKSEHRLEKLKTDGSQLVTNVAVAGDAKEVQRRQEEEEAKKARFEKLEAEVVAGAERFDEIMRKWSSAKGRKIPQELQELLRQQREACGAMTDEKDKLIGEFQQELKAKDDQYVKYLKKQAEDIDLILERMEEQTRTLRKAYREELGEIEGSFDTERRELVRKHQTEWEDAMKKRGGKEKEYLEARERRLEENEAQLQHLRVRNAEEFNRIKIKLETDIQILQQQIQQMKATFQMNAEKLEYNFQVLKKRDEENTVTISQQKRKLTRLQDSHNNHRAKLTKQEKAHHDDLVSEMDEYRKNTEMYRELQKKAKHFQSADAKRFRDIWVMNEETVRSLASDVLNADETIHRQQLGLDWEPPPPIESPMSHLLQQQQPRADTQVSQATLYASQVLSEGDSEEEPASEPPPTAPSAAPVYPSYLIRAVLELLCQESDFLIESKLTRLLAPLDKEEQMLMKLDSIFKALGVETEADVHTLAQFFLQDPATAEEEEEAHSQDGEEPSESEPRAEASSRPGPSLIHPNDVPQALHQFVQHLHPSSGKSRSTAGKRRTLTAHEEVLDGKFWEQIAQTLPESHERVWSALLEALQEYHSTLTARAQLINDTDGLRQQNFELRVLLHQYMQARINQELHHPPTLMLPVPPQPQSSF